MDNKILIFGNKVHGRSTYDIDLISDYQIDFQNFPDADISIRLTDYSIIIADYDAFNINGIFHSTEMERFEPQLHQALKKGAYVCFLHYEEIVPRYDPYNSSEGYMDSDDIKHLVKTQIGYQYLNAFNIRPYRQDFLNYVSTIKRVEFTNFLEQWGSSKNYFMYMMMDILMIQFII